MTNLCPEDRMDALISAIEHVDTATSLIDVVLEEFPQDARLHFLKGSTLASEGRLIEAHASLSRAVEIAPDFAIARFQLGFFQLTSGESDNAIKTWARLDALPKDHYLRIFVIGLRHLIRDELAECVNMLSKGISLNEENPPLNNDMRLLLERVKPLVQETTPPNADMPIPGAETTSITSFILNQQGDKPTKH